MTIGKPPQSSPSSDLPMPAVRFTLYVLFRFFFVYRLPSPVSRLPNILLYVTRKPICQIILIDI